MKTIQQISVSLLATLVAMAHPGLFLLIGAPATPGCPKQPQLATAQQLAPQKQQLVFNLAEQRGASNFSPSNIKPPAPAFPYHFSHTTDFLHAGYLVSLRCHQLFSLIPVSLEVRDIIFPFHSFW